VDSQTVDLKTNLLLRNLLETSPTPEQVVDLKTVEANLVDKPPLIMSAWLRCLAYNRFVSATRWMISTAFATPSSARILAPRSAARWRMAGCVTAS
jgi:hypothetical protein